MTIVAAVLVCLAVKVTLAEVGCQNYVQCPCGSKGENVTVCAPADFCAQLSKCETCEDGLNECSKCPAGFEGPFCHQEIGDRTISRQERQALRTGRVYSRSSSTSCSSLDSPKLGSITCVSSEQEQTCTGKCLTGFRFDVPESTDEMTLTCRGGAWTPQTVFPDCISTGDCDLEVLESGSINCTTGMEGTECYVYCYGRFTGLFFCYPGRPWEPPLPPCIQQKDMHEGHSRQKRQAWRNWNAGVRGRRPAVQNQRRPLAGQNPSYCTNLDSPKLGSIRCVTSQDQQTCTGKCLPGYRFDDFDDFSVHEAHDEMTLTCRGGTWTPQTTFPDCITGGHCDLEVRGSGSFNCTTGMEGTRCDVRCFGRYAGRFFCYPGRSWEPALPTCVKEKEISEMMAPISCGCQNGGRCDGNGRCICPADRTGSFCETRKTACRDPGTVPNGFRRDMDGEESPIRQNFAVGESVVYACLSEEYALQGSSLLTCQRDGTWSSPLPRCTKVAPEKTCSDPGHVANADRLNSDGSPATGFRQYRVGQSLVYTCRPGYALQRRSLITCLASGAWSFRLPYCTRLTAVSPLVINPPVQPTPSTVRFCRDPGTDTNGSRQPRNPPNRRRGFPQGTRLEYSCNQGYDLSGERSLFCMTSGEWSASRPRCEIQAPNPVTVDETDYMYCMNPGPISNGRVQYHPNMDQRRRFTPQPNELDDPEYPVGSHLQYSCNSGYSLKGQANLICESSGFWSSEAPVCTRDFSLRHCHSPGDVANAHVVFHEDGRAPTTLQKDERHEYPAGSRLEYSCEEGYSLEGAFTLTCENAGTWSDKLPTCITENPNDRLYCESPGPILNGRVRYTPPGIRTRNRPSWSQDYDLDEYPPGGELEYSCDEGYRVEGARIAKCQTTGFWSAAAPKCVGDCGRSFMKIIHKVRDGEDTVAGDWPWVVSISIQTNNNSQFICGGAILNSRTVLTAAHCLVVADSFTLRFGKHQFRIKDDDTQVLVRKSTRVIIHPDYSNRTMDSDIGLIMFQPRIRYSVRVQPVCLPTPESTVRNIMTGKLGYVSGWGDTEKGLPGDALMLASLPVITNEACLEHYRSLNMSPPITRNMFCAGHEDSRQTVCGGDSGSPFVFYDREAERFTIEGLVSFGVRGECGESGKYAMFTKVFRYLDWILRKMQ